MYSGVGHPVAFPTLYIARSVHLSSHSGLSYSCQLTDCGGKPKQYGCTRFTPPGIIENAMLAHQLAQIPFFSLW